MDAPPIRFATEAEARLHKQSADLSALLLLEQGNDGRWAWHWPANETLEGQQALGLFKEILCDVFQRHGLNVHSNSDKTIADTCAASSPALGRGAA